MSESQLALLVGDSLSQFVYFREQFLFRDFHDYPPPHRVLAVSI